MSAAKWKQELGNVEFNMLLEELMCLGRSFKKRKEQWA